MDPFERWTIAALGRSWFISHSFNILGRPTSDLRAVREHAELQLGVDD